MNLWQIQITDSICTLSMSLTRTLKVASLSLHCEDYYKNLFTECKINSIAKAKILVC